jgi:hypothetical protein
MKNYHPRLLYKYANEFLTLTFLQRFNIGMKMKVVEQYDALDEDDDVDLKIFTNVVSERRFPEFVRLIRHAQSQDVSEIVYEPN